jgi:TolB protein
MTKGLVIPFLLLLVVAVSCSTSNKKTLDLNDYRIAYNVYYDTVNGNYEIFSMKADGSDKKNISNSPGIDWVYYAYKDKIYFASDRDTTYRMYFLYEMDAEGNNVRKITDLRLEDSYMGSRNKGQELVVSGRIGKAIRQQLFLINTSDGSYKQITSDTTASFSDPKFTTDGKQIIFRHRQNRRDFQNEKAELWVMNVDGANKRQITHYPESDTTAGWHSYHAGPPSIIPSGDFISYISFQKGNYSIFSTSLGGSEVKQLSSDEINEGWHSWSPDGQWVVFDGSDLNSTWFDIFIMRADGSLSQKLSDDWRYEQGPVFVEI